MAAETDDIYKTVNLQTIGLIKPVPALGERNP